MRERTVTFQKLSMSNLNDNDTYLLYKIRIFLNVADYTYII